MIVFKAAWKRCVNFRSRAIGRFQDHDNVQELPKKPGADKATGLFVWKWMPPAAGTAGVAARKGGNYDYDGFICIAVCCDRNFSHH